MGKGVISGCHHADPVEHRAKAVKHSHAWIAECSCRNWLGGDHGKREDAEREAREHERRPEPLKPAEWSPEGPRY